MIARSHKAFGGNFLVIIGDEDKWKFKGGVHTYTRQLDEQGKVITLKNLEEFVEWKNQYSYPTLAIEIHENAQNLMGFEFPEMCNIMVGNEAIGLPNKVLEACDQVLTIPQFGKVGSLNVAVSASIAMAEARRGINTERDIHQSKFSWQ